MCVLTKANYTQLIKDSVCCCCPEMLALAHKPQKNGHFPAEVLPLSTRRAPVKLHSSYQPQNAVCWEGHALPEPGTKTREPSPGNGNKRLLLGAWLNPPDKNGIFSELPQRLFSPADPNRKFTNKQEIKTQHWAHTCLNILYTRAVAALLVLLLTANILYL